MQEKRSILAIVYGVLLLVLATISFSVYLFNIIADGIAQLYVLKIHSGALYPIMIGSPGVPIFLGALGILTILASNRSSKLKTWSYYIGIVPIIIFTIIWSAILMNSIVPESVPPGESSGGEIFLVGGILLLGLVAFIPLLISLFSILKNRNYLSAFVGILLLAIMLQVGLSLATLPYYEPSIIEKASNEKDISMCYKLLEGTGRYRCFSMVALSTLNLEYCYRIPKEYLNPYSGQRDPYSQIQCVADVEKVQHIQKQNNSRKFISNHGFSLEFPSDWQNYRYITQEITLFPAPQYSSPEHLEGYNVTEYIFGVSVQDNVFQIRIYKAEHWNSGIAVGPKSGAEVLGYKDNFVYVVWITDSTNNIPPYQTDDIDSILDSFRLI